MTFCFYSNIVSNTVKSGKFVILLAFNNFLYKILFKVPHEEKKFSICLNSGPLHKLDLIRPSLCLGSEKNFKVRVTNLPGRRLSLSQGRKEKGLTTNIYTIGQVQT